MKINHSNSNLQRILPILVLEPCNVSIFYFQVLLATIYVAIVVPFNASFPGISYPDTFHCIQNNNNTSTNNNNSFFMTFDPTFEPLNSSEMFNNSSQVEKVEDEDDGQRKKFVPHDVIVETIFIVGETQFFFGHLPFLAGILYCQLLGLGSY